MARVWQEIPEGFAWNSLSISLYWRHKVVFMFEVDVLARALRDYIREHAGEKRASEMDTPIGCGESFSGFLWGVAIAADEHLPLPPIFLERASALPGLRPIDHEALEKSWEELPPWWELAS
jgi:hypothetical protein